MVGDVPMVEIGELLRKEGYWDKLITTRQALYTWQGKTTASSTPRHRWCSTIAGISSIAPGSRPRCSKRGDDYVEAGKRMVGDELQFHMYGFDVALRSAVPTTSTPRGDHGRRVVGTGDPGVPGAVGAIPSSDEPAAAQDGLLDCGAGQPLRDVRQCGLGRRFHQAERAQTKDCGLLPAARVGKGRQGAAHELRRRHGHCILKSSKHQKEGWETLKFFMLNPDSAAKRYEMINLFPPVKDAFKDPRLHVKEEFFGDQDLGKLFQDLATDVPRSTSTRCGPEANTIINRAVSARYARANPRDAIKRALKRPRNRIKQEGY